MTKDGILYRFEQVAGISGRQRVKAVYGPRELVRVWNRGASLIRRPYQGKDMERLP